MKSFFDTSFSISVQNKDNIVNTLSLSCDEENYILLYNWLLKEYNSEEKAKALVGLKNINKFKENLNDIEVVSSNLKPIVFNSLEDWNKSSLAEKNFIYIVKKDAWFVSEGKSLDDSKVILRKAISCVKDFNRELYDELKTLEKVRTNSKKLDRIPTPKNKKSINI